MFGVLCGCGGGLLLGATRDFFFHSDVFGAERIMGGLCLAAARVGSIVVVVWASPHSHCALMKSARTTVNSTSFFQLGPQSVQLEHMVGNHPGLDRWCGPLLLKPSCTKTPFSEAATATEFIMPPSQIHITRTVTWPDAHSRNAAMRHCFIRLGRSMVSMQARMICVCSPQCGCFRNSPNVIPQHATTRSLFVADIVTSSFFRISQSVMCGNSLLIPLRVLVRGLARARQRGIPRWCIGAMSNPFVPRGYTSLVSLKSVRGEGVMLYLAGAVW